MKPDITCYTGDRIFIKCVNKAKPEEYSIYRVEVTKEVVQGDGLSDAFLYETTGYED